MTPVTFTVHGKPVGKARARRGAHGRWYTPPATVAYEEHVRQEWMAAGRPWVDGPVRLRINAFMRTPTGKPDGDNIAKAIMDALRGHAFDDDAQVVDVQVCKYPVPPLQPRVFIAISHAAENSDAA